MSAEGSATRAATRPGAALRALLAGIVDFAGLFPPAGLDMRAAVANYASYLRAGDRWALGRFVVPAARLEELEREAAKLLPRSADVAPWRLSALVGPDAEEEIARARDFNRRHAEASAGHAIVDTLEGKATTPDEVARLVRAADGFDVYVELPLAADPAPLVDALRAAGARAKVRTGGVTADAFPATERLARFLSACVRAGVPLKATAGLHHPVRGSYRLTYALDSPSATMYGFLNVFVAAALLHAGMPERELPALLEETDATAFRFDDDGVTWREWRAGRDALVAARRGVAVSFGSCSFEEPMGDLRALALL